MLLSKISDAVWQPDSPTGQERSITDIAAHIHHLRLMWLTVVDKTAAKLEPDKATHLQLQTALKARAAEIERLKALEHPGACRTFARMFVGFAGYLIAHDWHPSGQMATLARQVGHPVSPKAALGLWEWDTLWKESGYRGDTAK